MNALERGRIVREVGELIVAGKLTCAVLYGRSPTLNKLAARLGRHETYTKYRRQMLQIKAERLDTGLDRMTRRVELVDERGQPL